jgi:hypothetical protein
MNRCLTRALLACTLLLAALPASAQSLKRPFPPEALRGKLTMTQPPYARMDDRDVRLSPGARILSDSNTVVRPASLVGKEVVVNYKVDGRGQIQTVWILTAEEAKEKRRTLGVERNYVFESMLPEPDPRAYKPPVKPAAD